MCHATTARQWASRRLLIALSLGILSALLCYLRLTMLDRSAGDLSWAIRGAAQLWAGLNPYADPALAPGKP